jgi:hypothetical protein
MKTYHVKTVSGYYWTGEAAGYVVTHDGSLLLLPTTDANKTEDALFVVSPGQWEFIEDITQYATEADE